MIINYTEFTTQGKREENQDLLLSLTHEDNSHESLFAVIDGMGGLLHGAEAAEEIGDHLKASFNKILNAPDKHVALKESLHRINERVFKTGQSNRGATCSALLINDKQYFIAHTGDSRIFRISRYSTKLITEDQNLAFSMYSIGRKTYEEYLSGGGHNKLISFIGIGDGMDLLSYKGETAPGDIFLLCTDGLNQFLQLRQMEELGNQAVLKQDPYNFIVSHIRGKVSPNDSNDNVSWMCLQVG